ncbi:MAG: tetratricopeptide repeat protein, partial [Gemmataceae bacterium]
VLAGAAALLLLSVLAWRRAKSSPWLLMGWLWFVLTSLPVIGFAQGGRQAWADRFVYWPHIGLFAAIVWSAVELAQNRRLAVLAAQAAAVALLICFAVVTFKRVEDWRDISTLWEAAVRADPDNDRVRQWLGTYYRRQGLEDKAKQHQFQTLITQRRRLGLPPPRLNTETSHPAAPPPRR